MCVRPHPLLLPLVQAAGVMSFILGTVGFRLVEICVVFLFFTFKDSGDHHGYGPHGG